MHAEKSYPNETRIIYNISKCSHYSRKKWYRQIKKENPLFYVYLLTLTNV